MTISCQCKAACLVPCACLGWGNDDNRIYSLPYFIMMVGGAANQNVQCLVLATWFGLSPFESMGHRLKC